MKFKNKKLTFSTCVFISLLFLYFIVGMPDSGNRLVPRLSILVGLVVSALSTYSLIRREFEAIIQNGTHIVINRVHSKTKGHPTCFMVDNPSVDDFSQFELHYCEYPDELELYIPLIFSREKDIVLSPFVFEFLLLGSNNLKAISISNISVQISSPKGVLEVSDDFSSNIANVTKTFQQTNPFRLNLLLGVNKNYKEKDTIVDITLTIHNTNQAGQSNTDTLHAKVRWNRGNITMIES